MVLLQAEWEVVPESLCLLLVSWGFSAKPHFITVTLMVLDNIQRPRVKKYKSYSFLVGRQM